MIKVLQSHDTRIPQGSFLVSINGQIVDDILEYKFYNDASITRTLLIENDGIRRVVVIPPHEESVIDIEQPMFRECENRCNFCFINGLPQGLRRELYVRDDDYRLSFLFGNFVSLTNVTRDDIKRIGRLRLSPLYISVHTTEPHVRQAIFKNENAGYILDQLGQLVDEGIKLHCQIVVIPDINDGKMLTETISSLNHLYPGVQSVGIVPVGTTSYLRNIVPITRKNALDIVAVVNRLHAYYKRRIGVGFVYCADEFFAVTRQPIPETSYYDDFPQVENGIGMTRRFLDDIDCLHITKGIEGKNLLVTSVLAKPYVDILVSRLNVNCVPLSTVESVAVVNRLFGPTVTVSGLLSGGDITSALSEGIRHYDRIILPPNCTNDSGMLIDDYIFTDKRVMISPHTLQELVICLQS